MPTAEEIEEMSEEEVVKVLSRFHRGREKDPDLLCEALWSDFERTLSHDERARLVGRLRRMRQWKPRAIASIFL